MKDKSELENTIKKFIKSPYSEELIKYIRPSLRLKSNRNSVEEIGATKFGGAPDLPINMKWPNSEFDSNPYTFLAQINLSEIDSFEEEIKLPNNGMLYFFFNFDVWDDGIVIYVRDSEKLKRASIPEKLTFQKKRSFFARLFSSPPQKKILPECSVTLSNEYTISSWDSFFVEKIQLETSTSIKSSDIFKHDENDDFYSYLGEEQSRHRLLGHYDSIQHGYIETDLIDTKYDFNKPSLATINKALEWRLLFQFDSDNNMDLNIIDGGTIYFFIHEEDLAKNNFSNVKIHTQFH